MKTLLSFCGLFLAVSAVEAIDCDLATQRNAGQLCACIIYHQNSEEPVFRKYDAKVTQKLGTDLAGLIAELEVQQAQATQELGQPEEQRTESNPRFFLWRWLLPNPIDRKLKAQVRNAQRLRDRAIEVSQLIEATDVFYEKSNGKGISRNERAALIWVRDRVLALAQTLVSLKAAHLHQLSDSDFSPLADKIELLKKDVGLLAALDSENDTSPLIARAARSAADYLVAGLREKLAKQFPQKLSESTLHELVALSIQLQLPLDTIAERFADTADRLPDAEEHWIALTRISFRANQPAEGVVSTFSRLRQNTSFNTAEALYLTAAALTKDISPETIQGDIERILMNLQNRTLSGKRSSTIAALLYEPGTDNYALLEKYILLESHFRNAPLAPDYETMALMARLLQSDQDIPRAVSLYYAISVRFRDRTPLELASLYSFAFQFTIDAQTLRETVDLANNVSGEPLPLNRTLSLVAIAIADRYPEGVPSPLETDTLLTEQDLQKALQPPSLVFDSAEDRLLAGARLQAQKRHEYARNASAVPSYFGSRPGVSSENSAAASESKPAVTFGYYSDGFGSTLNISNSTGIDLSDFSLQTDIGGGWVYDWDDGFKFKWF